MEQPIVSALEAVLAGDVESMAVINSSTAEQLATAATGSTLVLTRQAVARVLTAYSAGLLSPADVQSWASFVRRGYVEHRNGNPVRALEIDLDHAYESAIAESIGRLDELGDLVDGSLREGEPHDLLNGLSLGD